MFKKIIIILGIVFLIFVFGFWAEDQLRKVIIKNTKESQILPTPLLVNKTKEKVKVLKVIDGDTIELIDGRKVRYIGINSFEMNDKQIETRCLAKKSKEANQKLVENKEIELEKDVSETDSFGRLLRYIWIDNVMLNNELVKNGWAEASSYPPDIKYQTYFLESQKDAKLNNLGMWGKICQ